MTTHNSRIAVVRAAAAALCLALLPAVAMAQSAPRKSAAPARSYNPLLGNWELGGSLGIAIPFQSLYGVGFKLNLDGFYGVSQLAPGLILQVGGNLGWSIGGMDPSGTYNLFDFLPAVRFRYAASPQVAVYGDAGMGMGLVSASVTTPGFPPFVPSVTSSATNAAFLMKFGGGVAYHVNPKLSLTFEPAFNIYIKSGSLTTFSLLAGVLWRI